MCGGGVSHLSFPPKRHVVPSHQLDFGPSDISRVQRSTRLTSLGCLKTGGRFHIAGGCGPWLAHWLYIPYLQKKKIILRDLRELEMSMSQISAVAACEDRLPLIPRDGHAALLPAFHSAVLPMRARTRGAAGTLPFFIPFPREIRPKYCTLLFWHSQSIRAETFYPTTIWPNKFLALLPWPPHSAPAFVLLAAPLPRLRCARGWEWRLGPRWFVQGELGWLRPSNEDSTNQNKKFSNVLSKNGNQPTQTDLGMGAILKSSNQESCTGNSTSSSHGCRAVSSCTAKCSVAVAKGGSTAGGTPKSSELRSELGRGCLGPAMASCFSRKWWKNNVFNRRIALQIFLEKSLYKRTAI